MSTKKADGVAGARKVASLLTIALCAETTSASLEEDWAKVDIKCSFRNAFDEKQLITYHCQVKSGLSYKAISSNDKNININIDKDTINALSNFNGIITWVPPKPSRNIYWYAINPRLKTKTPISIPRTQYINPSIRFDLSRISNYSRHTNSLPRQDISSKIDSNLLDRAKNEYKLLAKTKIFNPIVGELQISRFAWRHLTRRSKTTKRREFSLRLVPYLKSFLDHVPDRFTIAPSNFRTIGKKTIETRYLLCWYRGAFKINNNSYALLIRIKEEISYPNDWNLYSLSVEDIEQTATLASWWAKIEK